MDGAAGAVAAGAGFAAGAGAGAEEAAGAAAGALGAAGAALSAVADLLDLEDFLEEVEADEVDALASPAAAGAAAVVSAVAVFLLFVDLDLLLVDAAASVEEAEEGLAVESVEAPDFFDLEDFLVEVESAEASLVDFVFFLVELESVWSVDCEDCGFAAARREKLPARSSEAANKARNIGLREIAISGKSFRRKESPPEGHMGESAAGRVAGGVKVPSRAAVGISE